MNVWLVTTGSSDVQLSNKDGWHDWWQAVKSRLYRLRFEPSEAIAEDGEYYRLPARVLGIVDEQLSERVHSHLAFPLLQNFTQALKEKNIPINEIIVLTSDQENIFSEAQRESKQCPYWQDTCQIYPILERYFSKHFPAAVVKSLPLRPEQTHQGLDNWDEVLNLVQQEFAALSFETDPHTVYVSHQAGTPAISSAVQFTSLARFGDHVKFLVSNEKDKTLTRIVESSAYLKGLKREQAKKILDNYDYPGVGNLVKDDFKDETQILLEAALQWNFAKFDDFADRLETLSTKELQFIAQAVKERRLYWWWTAYEAAYLAWVRLKQGNIVEAFFHGFRAIEGAFSNWGKKEFSDFVKVENERIFLQPSILQASNDYFEGAKFKPDGTPKNSLAKLKKKLFDIEVRLQDIKASDQKPKGLLLSGEDLYTLFRSLNPDYEASGLIRFWNAETGISEKRNKIFHQLQGLSKADLLRDWEVNSLEEWEQCLLRYLNFIAKEDLPTLNKLPQEFLSLKEASLIGQVHGQLKSAIARL
jgi:hypothetical protein